VGHSLRVSLALLIEQWHPLAGPHGSRISGTREPVRTAHRAVARANRSARLANQWHPGLYASRGILVGKRGQESIRCRLVFLCFFFAFLCVLRSFRGARRLHCIRVFDARLR
jgi:hypothetical protein